MSSAALAVLFVAGVVLFCTGFALVFPPAAFVVAGSVCVAVALKVEVRDS